MYSLCNKLFTGACLALYKHVNPVAGKYAYRFKYLLHLLGLTYNLAFLGLVVYIYHKAANLCSRQIKRTFDCPFKFIDINWLWYVFKCSELHGLYSG